MTAATTRRPVTIVVPVYGDPASLERCVRALLRLVEAPDRVLLVNDCGPEADAIERMLLGLVADRAGFDYARNDRNLGFVGTCNRAALDLVGPGCDILLLNSDAEPTPGFLDELTAVLHASPDNGIVCARSDNATIASLPHRVRDLSLPRTRERTTTVHAAIAPLLGPSAVVPVAMGFCFLVRRELIEDFGLFDEAFAPGYGEENDFCLRMGARGYRSLLAHRALVFHEGARSFENARRRVLRIRHEALLRRRHPGYADAVRAYLIRDADPVDVFADLLVPSNDLPRVLIDLVDVPPSELPRLAPLLEGFSALAVAGRARVAVQTGARPAPALPGVTRVLGSSPELADLAVVPSSGATRGALVRRHADALRRVAVGDTPVSGDVGDWDAVVADTGTSTVDRVLAIATRPVDVTALRARWARWGAEAASVIPLEVTTPRERIVVATARRAPWLLLAADAVRARRRRRRG